MALYPSLEDMTVDQMIKAQLQDESHTSGQSLSSEPAIPSAPRLSELMSDAHYTAYPSLNDYMGLELSANVIAANMPEYLNSRKDMAQINDRNLDLTDKFKGLLAPLSGQSLGLQKAYVTNGIRQATLCKDENGKIGVRVQSINNGIFINLVAKNSPAAMAGLRFGDQVLEINGKSVAGLSVEAVYDFIKKAPNNGIYIAIRDRPFERTVTLHKDSTGHVGFSFKEGKVIGLVIDSSAAKNGLLTEHYLLEINGQNVVGLKDKEITKIISEGGDVITVTIIPSFIFQHMTKRMSSSLLKSLMDHSLPTF